MTRLVCSAQWVVVTALLLNLFVSSRGLARCQECCTCSDGPSQCSACVSNGCCCGPKTLFLWNCCPEDQDEDDDDTIVTDRPDFTESASTVGLGRVQLEMGYSYAYDKEIPTSASAESYPELLTRIGLFADWFELRIGWTLLDVVDRTPAGRVSQSGSADLSLGIKWALTPQCGIRPQMAIITQMFVPSGDSDFTLDETLPGINLIYSWDLSDRLSFAGNTQGIRFVDDSGHGTTELAQSLTIGASITEQLGSYIEWFGLFPHSSNDPNVVPLHVLDGGFTYLITNNVQYDIRGELGLNSAAPDYGVGTGLSVRF